MVSLIASITLTSWIVHVRQCLISIFIIVKLAFNAVIIYTYKIFNWEILNNIHHIFVFQPVTYFKLLNSSARECVQGEFKCGDGSCIDNKWRCDQVSDCIDGSDEVDCGGKLLRSLHFIKVNNWLIATELIICTWTHYLPTEHSNLCWKDCAKCIKRIYIYKFKIYVDIDKTFSYRYYYIGHS